MQRNYLHKAVLIHILQVLSFEEQHKRSLKQNSIQLDSWKVATCEWKLLSCVRFFATPGTIQSMEFSRPEFWSG